MDLLIAGTALGFLGSFHCVGMCGPIALALPVHNRPPFLKYTLIVLYNLGRITSYSLFGLVAGTVGKSFAMAGLQQGLSVGVGIFLLASVIFSFNNSFSGFSFFLWIKAQLGSLFKKGSRSSLFTVGLLNGFLPCGLVYVGIAGATATGDVLNAVLFMAAFGIGTVPLMFAASFIGSSISVSTRSKIRKATPVIVTAMALLLILRGLNLGIAYISPKITGREKAMSCHEVGPDPVKIIRCEKPQR